MKKTLLLSNSAPAHQKKGGFTLVEILVAVAIMALLLGVIVVPLRLGFESFHIGKARAEVQQQAQLTVNRIANDIRKSQFVYANTNIPGVSDNTDTSSPCSSSGYRQGTASNTYDWNFRPYVISDIATNTDNTAGYGVCSTLSSAGTPGVRAWNNPSRIEMLQLRRDKNGQLMNTNVGQDFIISYYPRRLNLNRPFDIIDNPIVLFRAQIPFRGRDANDNPGADYKSGTDFNADVDWTHYPDSIGNCPSTATPPATNRSFQWITHNYFGEANLEPLTTDDATGNVVPGAHTLVTPRDMSLVAPLAGTGKSESLVPELTFTEEATNGKRIDRVTITMTLAQYDQAGVGQTNGQAAAQRVRVSQTVDLPNVACGP